MAFIQNLELDWNTWKTLKAGSGSSDAVYYLQNDLQYVPFFIQEGATDAAEYLYYVNVNRDPSSVSGPYAALTSGAQAHVTIQDITYTANVYGTGGNSITVQYVNDATAVGEEFVTVSGTAITVHIVSGKSTAQQVVSAAVAWSAYNGLINKSQASAELIGAVVSGNSGTPQTTQGPTSLAGGAAAVTVLSDWTANFLGSATKVGSFMNGVALEVA